MAKYINIDDRNLIMIEGVNAEEVEGIFSNKGKCTIFETKKEMRTYLCNRVREEKEAKETRVNSNGKWVKVHKDDLERRGKEIAVTLAREKLEIEKEKANIQKSKFSKAELAEAYFELKGVPPHLAIFS